VLKNNNNPLTPPPEPVGNGKVLPMKPNGSAHGNELFPEDDAGQDDAADSSVPTDEAALAKLDAHLPPKRRELRKLQRAAVRRLFGYYLKGTEKNPKLYTLTRARMDKGLSRLEDCLRKCDGDLEKAERVMGVAIDRLLASEFHMGKNEQRKVYCDWIAHLFKSTEKLEWWLAHE
jgi:hypothetical protein